MSKPQHKDTPPLTQLLNSKACVKRSCEGIMIPVLVRRTHKVGRGYKSTEVDETVGEWECTKCKKFISRHDPLAQPINWKNLDTKSQQKPQNYQNKKKPDWKNKKKTNSHQSTPSQKKPYKEEK